MPSDTHLQQLIDERLAAKGLAPLRDHLLGDAAAWSWAAIAAWVGSEAGLTVSRSIVHSWYALDAEIQAARTAARPTT